MAITVNIFITKDKTVPQSAYFREQLGYCATIIDGDFFKAAIQLSKKKE